MVSELGLAVIYSVEASWMEQPNHNRPPLPGYVSECVAPFRKE